MQFLNRYLPKISIGLAGVALIALAVIVLNPSPAPAQPIISWMPESVNETVLAGETKTVSVSFTTLEDLGAVEVRVVPELEPYVTMNPASFPNIAAGQVVNLDLNISAPSDVSPQVVEGTIQIRNVGQPPRNYARPLPITVTVFTGAPFSTDPDPEKVVSDPDGGVYPVNQVVVNLIDGATLDDAVELAELVNGRIIGFVPAGNLYQLEAPTTSIDELNAVIDILENDQRVEHALQNIMEVLDLSTTDLENLRNKDPSLTKAYDILKLQNTYELIDDLNPSLSSVKIGIIDTGIDKNHPEFDGITVVGASVDNGAENDCQGTIESHGTEVSGIIGANNLSETEELPENSPHMNGIISGIFGVQYSLIVPRKRGLFGFRTFHNIVESITVDGGQIVNMSFSNTLCSALPDNNCFKEKNICVSEKQYNKLKDDYLQVFNKHSNIIFVASAGNSGISAIDQLPGGGISLPNLITVAATTLDDSRASFSNFGRQATDIAAPGEGIYAPRLFKSPLDDGDYRSSITDGFFRGTSGAAPIVAGVAAMLKVLNHELSPSEIKTILQETADPIATGEPNKLLGSGCGALLPIETGCRLNAFRAVQRVLGVEPEPSTKFSIGDLIQVNTGDGSNLNVRSTPNGSIVGQQSDGAQGVVIGGPVFAGGFWWWDIDYDDSPDGWSAEDFLELAPRSDQRANLSIVLEPNSVPQNASDPCLETLPAWYFFATLAETEGVGITITSFTWDFFDDAGNYISTQTDTGDTFADWFDRCSPGSSRIAPYEQACGPLCAHLGTRDSGSIIFTFFGTDDNGNDISSQSEPLVLLGSGQAMVRRLHQKPFTTPQVTRR